MATIKLVFAVIIFVKTIDVGNGESLPTYDKDRELEKIESLLTKIIADQNLLDNLKLPKPEKPCSLICFNGGKCTIDCKKEVCQCPKEYEGEFCELPKDKCGKFICKNQGKCVTENGKPKCLCSEGFEGSKCEIEIKDPCDPPPCLNDGACYPDSFGDEDDYICKCRNGFHGKRCEGNPCSDGPCKNNGTCHPTIGSFTCTCKPEFQGELCQTANPCFKNPCKNQGKCNVNADDRTSFTCECLRGFKGNLCEIEDKPCSSSPCKNDADCENVGDHFYCNCTKGFAGKRCENRIHPCNATHENPCLNGGICKVMENCETDYECECPPGFTGNRCEKDERPCTIGIPRLLEMGIVSDHFK